MANGYYPVRDEFGLTRLVHGDSLLPQDDSHLFEDEPTEDQIADACDRILADEELDRAHSHA